jgi:O-antigen ligase
MKNQIHKINYLFWGMFLFLLPITSLPLTAKLLRSSMVAAPSIIFMGLLLVFWMVPKALKQRTIYFSKPFLLFFVFSVLSSFTAYFLDIPLQKNLSLFQTQAEGLITLFIGFGFFILISNFITTESILIKTIQIIAISMIPLFIWSGVQLVSWMLFGAYSDTLINIQSLLSTSGNLYRGRITGFAFEPSWFAHTLTIFYIPLWLGLTIQNISVFRKKFLKISFENILLFFSIVFLIFTKSRIGLVTLAFMSIYLMIKIHTYLIKQARELVIHIFKINLSNFYISGILTIIYIIGLITSIFFISKFDKRMENLLNPATYQNQQLSSIANEFQIAERVMYWQAGWRVFNDYPILGVGLGNSGFFFEEKLSSFTWALDEPRNIFYREDYLPNNKNLWTKILSETGIVGFSMFFIWLVLIWSQANLLKRHNNPLYQGIGYAGLFAMIAFVFEGFSIDSFALPYYWLIAGFVSAVYQYLYLLPRKSE